VYNVWKDGEDETTLQEHRSKEHWGVAAGGGAAVRRRIGHRQISLKPRRVDWGGSGNAEEERDSAERVVVLITRRPRSGSH
jgi:hypothetical protein